MYRSVVANNIRIKLKALLILGSAVVLVCCGSANDAASGSGESNEYLITESSTDLIIHMSENGRTSYIFEAPLVKGYTLASEPYRIFPDGIKITTFSTDDSLNTSTVNGVLTANYATYYEDRQLWEAIGDVLVVKSDGRELSSQQLFWDAVTKRIYSNVDTRIEDHSTGDLYNGEGFESNEEMTEWSFRKLKGRMRVEESANKGRDKSSSGNSSDVEVNAADKGVSDTLSVDYKHSGTGVPDMLEEDMPDDVLDLETGVGVDSINTIDAVDDIIADTVVVSRGRGYAAKTEFEKGEVEEWLDMSAPDLTLSIEEERDRAVTNDSMEVGAGLVVSDPVVMEEEFVALEEALATPKSDLVVNEEAAPIDVLTLEGALEAPEVPKDVNEDY